MCVSLSQGFYQDMPSYIACSLHDLIQPLSFSSYSLPIMCFTLYLQNTPAQCLGGCHIPSLLSFTKLSSRIRKFFTCTQEKIHRNLKNPRQHFETSKEKDTMHLNIFYNSPLPFLIQPPLTRKEMSYLKGDWLLYFNRRTEEVVNV